MSLSRKLQRVGNSIGAIIPKTLREVLGWNENQELEYEAKGNSLTLKPAKQKPPETIDLLGDVK